MSATTLLLCLLIAADLGLWVMAIAAPLSSTGQFRAYVAAVVLLVFLSAHFLDWSTTLGIAAVALWVAAIVVSSSKRLAAR